jgi:methylmalonyl-CoA mutase
VTARSWSQEPLTRLALRTTLQALYALFENCNSSHTNAFDEAITTPTPTPEAVEEQSLST